MSGRWALALGCLAAAAGACTHAPDPVPEVARVDPSVPVSELVTEIAPVDHPDLTRMSAVIRVQLTGQREELETILAEPGATAGALAEAFGALGMLYHAYSLREAATACYDNARRLQPQDFRWSYLPGRLDHARGRLERAVERYLQAHAIRPDDVTTLLWLGRSRLDGDEPDEAERWFERALAAEPDSVAALCGSGQAALAAGRAREAARRFEAALELEPDSGVIHYQLGAAFRELGETDRAREHLARAMPGSLPLPDPHMAEVLALAIGPGAGHATGAVALRRGQVELAVKAFRGVVEAHPADPGARVNLAAALAQAGDLTSARVQLEEALRLDPAHVEAHVQSAFVDLARGGLAEAEAHLRTAIAHDPRHGIAHRGLSEVLLRSGDAAGAVATLEKVVELDPADVDARLGLAEVLTLAGRHARSLDVLERSRDVMPDEARLVDGLARLLAASPEAGVRDGARALGLIEPVASAERRTLSEVQTLAMAYAEVGRFDDATAWQERALDAARRLGRGDQLAFIERNLALFRTDRPSRQPWPTQGGAHSVD